MLSVSTGSETDSNVWTNPMNNNNYLNVTSPNLEHHNHSGRVSSSENRIPESIQKEMDQRKIGESITNIANKLRRHNSWENNSRPGSGMLFKNQYSDASNRNNKIESIPARLIE